MELTCSSFAVPPVAYAYLGVESTAIAAYEAKTTRSIARASQSIHWVVVLVYFLCTLGIVLTLDWQDANLPLIWGTDDVGNVGNSKPTNPESSSATIIAIWNKNRGLADVANACLIFSILSSANTCLYIASRTMYGVTYHLRGTNPFSRYFKRTVGKVWTPTKVPAMALFISALLFYWLPFLTLIGDGGNVGADTVGGNSIEPLMQMN